MSKLNDITINTIVKDYLNKPKSKVVDRLFADGHDLPDLAQRRILIYGKPEHIEKTINQPKMTHSTAWLAHDICDNHMKTKSVKTEKRFQAIKSTLHSNFPLADQYHKPDHIHTNVNHKPKNPK